MNAVEFSEIVCPVPTWDRTLWTGGHFYSGREPSTPIFDPTVNGRAHVGIDLDAGFTAQMVSPYIGVINQRIDDPYHGQPTGPGNWLAIKHRHTSGRYFYSRHLHIINNGFLVTVGQKVEAGQPIALVGSTGGSSGPHDHFELLWDKPVAAWWEDLHIDVELILTGTAGRKDAKMIKDLQEMLRDLGYYLGTVDGIWGPKSKAALKMFMEAALVSGAGVARDHVHRNRFAKVTGTVARWL